MSARCPCSTHHCEGSRLCFAMASPVVPNIECREAKLSETPASRLNNASVCIDVNDQQVSYGKQRQCKPVSPTPDDSESLSTTKVSIIGGNSSTQSKSSVKVTEVSTIGGNSSTQSRSLVKITNLDTCATYAHPPPDYVAIALLVCLCFPFISLPFLLFSCLARSAQSRQNLPLAWHYSRIALCLFTAEMIFLLLTLIASLMWIWLLEPAKFATFEGTPINESVKNMTLLTMTTAGVTEENLDRFEDFVSNINLTQQSTALRNFNEWHDIYDIME